MTTSTAMNFEKFAQEGNLFMRELGEMLGHAWEEDRAQVGRLLRAVLDALREQISTGQSLHLISQFPMFLKALYVDQWKIAEQRDRLKTWEDFTALVEEKQKGKGEMAFDWEEPTDLLVKRTLIALGKYISAGFQRVHVC